METLVNDGRQYDTSAVQRTSGQAKFREELVSNFDKCWHLIYANGFQTGWKKITGKPQHGNSNPNWKDCLDFVEATIYNGKHLDHKCPWLPIQTGLPDRRNGFSDVSWWAHMWALCKLNQECVRVRRNAKKSGLIAMLYPLLDTPRLVFIKAIADAKYKPQEED